MIKLIATDVDGTLIKDSTPRLYQEMKDAIKILTAKQIVFCAASGRQYASLQNVFHETAEEIAYIAENGAYIRYKNSDIGITPMKEEYVRLIIEELRKYSQSADVIVSTPRGTLVESQNKAFINLLTYGYRNRIIPVKDVLETGEDILKISIYREGSIRELGEEELIPRWKDRVKVCMAGDEWVDFMDSTVDKGNALKVLQKHLGITREETMAFGDNNNDIGMMNAAGESYCVSNGREEVLQAAKHVAEPYWNKGVYRAIKQAGLLE